MAAITGSSLLRTPRQASYTFGLGGPSSPRPKNLFYCTITKVGIGSAWQNTLGFLVKSVDRPQVAVQVEELNQYNKKRQINTGFKVSPVRMVIYDTKDSLALQFWNEYASQYFGDFRHEQNLSDFGYDVVSNQFLDAANAGFGFAPSAVSQSSTDINEQFFIAEINIYQVYGAEFTKYSLINPKITSFDPEGLSYEDSAMGTIGFAIAYEAVIYANGGAPQPISSDNVLSAAFGDYNLYGDTYEFPDGTPVLPPTPSPLSGVTTQIYQPYPFAPSVSQSTAQSGSNATGSLSSFGSYNFGSLSNNVLNTASDIALIALSNPTLASALNIIGTDLGFSGSSLVATNGNPLTDPYTQQASLNPAIYDLAAAVVANEVNAGGITDSIIAGIVAASAATGTSPAQLAAAANQLSLALSVYYTLNTQGSSTIQIGVNTDVSGASSLNGQSVYADNYIGPRNTNGSAYILNGN
jgi:hypothetical protein